MQKFAIKGILYKSFKVIRLSKAIEIRKAEMNKIPIVVIFIFV